MAEEQVREKEVTSEKGATPEFAPPPVAPPPIVTQVHRREGRRWTILATYLIVALLVAAGVVFGGRWIYHKVHKSNNAQPAPASGGKVPQAPTSTNKQSGASSSTNKPSTSSGQSSSSQPPTSTPQGGQITNTGPGDVIAIFVASSLAAAALHYIISLRRSRE